MHLFVHAFIALAAAGAGAEHKKLAVLQFEAQKGLEIDRQTFSARLQNAARKTAPDLFVMTQANIESLVTAAGKSLEQCEGQCAVETGKLIGADLVMSGRIARVGRHYAISVQLYDTASGELLSGEDVDAKSEEELLANSAGAAQRLLQSLGAHASAQQAEAAPDVALQPLPRVPPVKSATASVKLGASVDALVARDAALKADALGEEHPDEAAAAWDKVAALRDDNPFREEAEQRAAQWHGYAPEKKKRDVRQRDDANKLGRLLPLASISEADKLRMFQEFEKNYGSNATASLLEALEPEALPSRMKREAIKKLEPACRQRPDSDECVNACILGSTVKQCGAGTPRERDAKAARLANEAFEKCKAHDFSGAIMRARAALAQKPTDKTTLGLANRSLGYAYAYQNDTASAAVWFKKYRPYCTDDCFQVDKYLAR